MKKLACVFPGQGSQEVGMGKAFYDNFAVAKAVYDEVDDALSLHLSRIMFEGDADTLTATEHAQPAIMCTSIAILRVLEAESDFSIKSNAAYAAGHSLGEYSALCAAGVLGLSDTARLLRLRGRAMQEAAPKGSGTMAALLGLEIEQVETLLAQADGVCDLANDNAPGQVVISGERGAVESAMQAAKEAGAKRAIELNVSAPFHSSLIQDAAIRMDEALQEVAMHSPTVPVIANVTAEAVTDVDVMRKLLVQQVTGRVRWRESVAYMVRQGVSDVMEIGHGTVLSGLNRRIDRSITSHTINKPEAIETVFSSVA